MGVSGGKLECERHGKVLIGADEPSIIPNPERKMGTRTTRGVMLSVL